MIFKESFKKLSLSLFGDDDALENMIDFFFNFLTRLAILNVKQFAKKHVYYFKQTVVVSLRGSMLLLSLLPLSWRTLIAYFYISTLKNKEFMGTKKFAQT